MSKHILMAIAKYAPSVRRARSLSERVGFSELQAGESSILMRARFSEDLWCLELIQKE